MGFWRNVGYVWSVLMILAGIALLPYGLVSVLLGIFLIFILRHNAHEERMEKYMNRMTDMSEDATDKALFKEWLEKRKQHGI